MTCWNRRRQAARPHPPAGSVRERLRSADRSATGCSWRRGSRSTRSTRTRRGRRRDKVSRRRCARVSESSSAWSRRALLREPSQRRQQIQLRARRTASSATAAAESASRAWRCASITSRFVVAPASKATFVIVQHFAAPAGPPSRRLASARSRAAHGLLRQPHFRPRLNLQSLSAPAATMLSVGFAQALQPASAVRRRKSAVRTTPRTASSAPS